MPLATIHTWLPPEAANMVNFIWHSTAQFPGSAQGALIPQVLFDPDHSYARNPKTNTPAFDPATYRYYAKNANYTHPDLNNLFLAKLDPTTGRVLVPSLHRPWLMMDPTGAGDPAAGGAPYGPPPNPPTMPITGLPPSPVAGEPNPWTNMWGRLLTLRPRPVDHQWPPGSGISYFPYPTVNINAADGSPMINPDGSKSYGDVQNMENIPGGKFYDSIWIDPDLPVRRWQGKNYKPLVSFLVLDLDGRINLNTAGNYYPLPLPSNMPPQYAQASHQGMGPWEVNPAQVMFDWQPRSPTAMVPAPPPPPYIDTNGAAMLTRRPFLAKAAAPYTPYQWVNSAAPNRFGAEGDLNNFGGLPSKRFSPNPGESVNPNMPAITGPAAPFYSLLDFSGRSPTLTPIKASDSSTGAQTGLVFGPAYIPAGVPTADDPARPDPSSPFDNGLYLLPNGTFPGYTERTDHPSLYSPYLVGAAGVSAGADRRFGVEELRYLNRKYNNSPGDYAGSDLAALAAATLGKMDYQFGQKNARFLTTVLSSDFNKPGASPWLPAVSNTYALPGYPGGTPRGTPQPLAATSPGGPVPTGGDHDAAYRAALAVLGPVDINRKLSDYRLTTAMPYSRDNVGNAQRAEQDRQRLALDIFDRLLMVTMGKVSGNPNSQVPTGPGLPTFQTGLSGPGTPGNLAERWLAQLAVNIVDFLDVDDIMTAFQWNPTGGTPDDQMVYGFERPKLVINETYIRYESVGMAQTEVDMTTMNRKPAVDPASPTMSRYPHKMKVWMELHNPVTPMSTGEQQTDPMGDNGVQGGYRARLVETDAAGGEVTAYQILPYKVPMTAGPDPLKLKVPDNYDKPTGTPRIGAGAGAVATGVLPLMSTTSGQHPISFVGADVQVVGGGGKVVDANVGANFGGAANKSFYVLGPKSDADAMATPPPGLTANLNHGHLEYDLPEGDVLPQALGYKPTWSPAFVLQRLANPYLPMNPLTNPFITVDYSDAYTGADPTANPVYDRAEFQFDAMRAAGAQPGWETTFAWGRRQPYDARVDYAQPAQFRQGNGMAGAGQVGGHTFKTHNAKAGTWPGPAAPGQATDQSPGNLTPNETLQYPFMPLAHLDRAAISPAELLHVVATKPHELTHTFNMLSATKRRPAFVADWTDESNSPTEVGKSSFLFRALDYLRTPHAMAGIPNGGRVPGRVNLNTMTLPDTLFAIADPKRMADVYDNRVSQNRFSETEVDSAWKALMGWGSPFGRDAAPGGVSKDDRPFKGLATDVAVAGDTAGPGQNSMDRTFLRTGALYGSTPNPNAEDFTSGAAGNAGAYQKYEMLSKTFNHYTTRSNAFAVYMTIGYFEVMNDGPYTEAWRPILGKELGTDDGNITRHKFFAVVDRTNLTREVVPPGPTPTPTKQGQAPVYLPYEPEPQPGTGLPAADQNDPDLATVPAGIPAPVDPTRPLTNPWISVRVPATGQAMSAGGSTVTGTYDGTQWTLTDFFAPGVASPPQVELESNGVKYQCAVRIPVSAYDGNGTARILLTPAAMQPPDAPPTPFPSNFRIERGATIRILDPGKQSMRCEPANPGPQPGFDYRASRYAPVVRYAEQVQ